MILTEEQEIKLAWLVNKNKAKGFIATNPELYGFNDVQYNARIDDVEFVFEFRLFPKDKEFKYSQFTPMKFCKYIPEACEQLEKTLHDLLQENQDEN